MSIKINVRKILEAKLQGFSNNNIASTYGISKEGAYPNMRMLRNDIEDAINFEILKARGIIQ